MKSQYIKRVVLALILILPSAIYIILTTGKHNFIHLPFVGPQTDSTFHVIPDFAFPNQFGDTITSKDYRGNIYVANFVFTTCSTICPVTTFQMRRVQQKFEEYPNFMILSHSVNPVYDTPEVLLDYAKKMQADLRNWNFVTGSKESIYEIAPFYFVNAMEDEEAAGGFLHSEFFVLVDKEGRIRSREDDNGNIIGVYDGTDVYEVGLLIEDIKVLMAEYNLAKKDK